MKYSFLYEVYDFIKAGSIITNLLVYFFFTFVALLRVLIIL